MGAQPILVLTGKGRDTQEQGGMPRKTLVFDDLAEASRHLIATRMTTLLRSVLFLVGAIAITAPFGFAVPLGRIFGRYVPFVVAQAVRHGHARVDRVEPAASAAR